MAAGPQRLRQQEFEIDTIGVVLEGGLQLGDGLVVQATAHIQAGQRAACELQPVVFAARLVGVQLTQCILNGRVVGGLLKGPFHVPHGAVPLAPVHAGFGHPDVGIPIVGHGAQHPQEDVARFLKAALAAQRAPQEAVSVDVLGEGFEDVLGVTDDRFQRLILKQRAQFLVVLAKTDGSHDLLTVSV